MARFACGSPGWPATCSPRSPRPGPAAPTRTYYDLAVQRCGRPGRGGASSRREPCRHQGRQDALHAGGGTRAVPGCGAHWPALRPPARPGPGSELRRVRASGPHRLPGSARPDQHVWRARTTLVASDQERERSGLNARRTTLRKDGDVDSERPNDQRVTTASGTACGEGRRAGVDGAGIHHPACPSTGDCRVQAGSSGLRSSGNEACHGTAPCLCDSRSGARVRLRE